MAWLNKPSGPPPPPAAPKASFDVPVRFHVRGVTEAVQGTLLHIAVSGCRLRSWLLMDRGTGISLQWRLGDGKVLDLAGVVAARYAPRNGGVGFEYAVAFEAIPEADADALSREAAMLQRRASSARSYDTSLVDISQFTGYRVPADFPLSFKIDDPRVGAKSGHGCDLSGNMLRLRTSEALRQGQNVALTFRLPDGVLGVHQGKDDELVTGPFGYRRVPRKYLRRPFEELRLRARVLGAVTDSQHRQAFELELLDVDGLAREEIARYIHAAQLARLKR